MGLEYIGVYDSGIGGLNILKKLTAKYKSENFVYLGDNNHAPYGTKTFAELFQRAYICIDELCKYNLKALVIACNTMSAVCGRELISRYSFKVITVQPDLNVKGQKILVTGTPNTLKHISMQNLDPTKYYIYPVPALAGDIEKNIDSISKLNVYKYFEGLPMDFDRVILGCTHYPFVRKQIKKIFPYARIDDGSNAVIKSLKGLANANKDNLSGEVKFIGECAEKNEQLFNLMKK